MPNGFKTLVSNLFCDISRCRCGVYSVRIEKMTVQLTALQFSQIARAFKLVCGMSAVSSAEVEPQETDCSARSHPSEYPVSLGEELSRRKTA